MSNTLMDTVSLNKKSRYFMTVSPSPAKPETAPAPTPDNAGIKSGKNSAANMLTAALSGLTVLGLAVTVKNNLSRKKLLKQTDHLRQQIKTEYLAAHSSFIEEFNRSKLPEPFQKFGKITSFKDFNAVKTIYEESLAKLTQKKSDISKKIKTSLSELSTDKEWKELRAMRKQLLKDLGGKNPDKQELAERKLPFVNDLLVLKLHPDKENIFQTRNLTTPDDLRQLLKKDYNHAGAFDEELQKHIKFDFEYNEMENFFHNNGKLSLINLFKEEMRVYNQLSYNIRLKKINIDEEISVVKNLWLKKLSTLAEDFRQKENVKKYKELTTRK